MAGGLPTITSHRKMPERFWIPLDFRCRRWRPAKLRGHSVSSALPCISFHKRAEGTAGTFQRGNFPNLDFIRKRISLKLSRDCLHTIAKNSQHTTSLDVLAEPNYYSKWVRTSSTRVFASHYDGKWKARRNHDCVTGCVRRAGAFREGSFAKNARISTAGSRFARARKTPQLADSASSLYTTSFPIHLTVCPHSYRTGLWREAKRVHG